MQPLYNRIAMAIGDHEQDSFDPVIYNTLDTAIRHAWATWGQEQLADYYVRGVKPKDPPFAFRKDYIERNLNAAPDNYRALIDSFKDR